MKFCGILHDGHIFENDVFEDFKYVIHDLLQFSNGKNIEGIVIIVKEWDIIFFIYYVIVRKKSTTNISSRNDVKEDDISID